MYWGPIPNVEHSYNTDIINRFLNAVSLRIKISWMMFYNEFVLRGIERMYNQRAANVKDLSKSFVEYAKGFGFINKVITTVTVVALVLIVLKCVYELFQAL